MTKEASKKTAAKKTAAKKTIKKKAATPTSTPATQTISKSPAKRSPVKAPAGLLKTINPELHEIANRGFGIAEQLGRRSLEVRWSLGSLLNQGAERVRRLIEDGEAAGLKIQDECSSLASLWGVTDRTDIFAMRALASAWTKTEMQEEISKTLKNGKPITWSHLSYSMSFETAGKRKSYLSKVRKLSCTATEARELKRAMLAGEDAEAAVAAVRDGSKSSAAKVSTISFPSDPVKAASKFQGLVCQVTEALDLFGGSDAFFDGIHDAIEAESMAAEDVAAQVDHIEDCIQKLQAMREKLSEAAKSDEEIVGVTEDDSEDLDDEEDDVVEATDGSESETESEPLAEDELDDDDIDDDDIDDDDLDAVELDDEEDEAELDADDDFEEEDFG